MSFWDKVKDFTRPYADDDYDDYEDEVDTFEEEEEIEEPAPRARRSSPFASTPKEPEEVKPAPAPVSSSFSGQVLNMNGGKQEVVLFHARVFDDAAKAADELRKRKAVILNMENVDKSVTCRVVDFLAGAAYALDGSVKKIAQCTYLFCPHNMAVVGELENMRIEGQA